MDPWTGEKWDRQGSGNRSRTTTGATGQGKVGTDCARKSFGPPGMGQKHRRAVEAGRWDRRPGGRSLRDQAREGVEEAGAKRERINVDR